MHHSAVACTAAGLVTGDQMTRSTGTGVRVDALSNDIVKA